MTGADLDETVPLALDQEGFCCPAQKAPNSSCRALCICVGAISVFLLGGVAASILLYLQFSSAVENQMKLQSQMVATSSWDHDVTYCKNLLAQDALRRAAKDPKNQVPGWILNQSALADFSALSDNMSSAVLVQKAREMETELTKVVEHQQSRLKEVEEKLASFKADNAALKKDNLQLTMNGAVVSHDRMADLLQRFKDDNSKLKRVLADISSAAAHRDCFEEVQTGWPLPVEGHRDYSNGAALGIYVSMGFEQCLSTCARTPQCKAAVWKTGAKAACIFQTAAVGVGTPFRQTEGASLTYVKKPSCPAATPAASARPRENATRAADAPRYAYVMMAYDNLTAGMRPGDSIYPVLAMARALQRLSSHPLVLLTNTTHFEDGTPVATSMREFGVEVRPMYTVPVPRNKSFDFTSWNVAWWKLQIWSLTQYDKLIWLDSDAIVTRSMDWLFARDGMWAQRDDWYCALGQPDVCSGVMLMEPNSTDLEHMLKFASSPRGRPGLAKGDQGVIEHYFREVRGKPVQLLTDVEAAFGQCVGKAPSPFTDVRGAWNIPAFVHKSGGWGNTNNNEYINVCFSHKISRQYYTIGNETVNICHYNALGVYWRDLFCEGLAMAAIRDPEANAFCSDDCWYHGIEPPTIDANQTYGKDATKKLWCTPVDASVAAISEGRANLEPALAGKKVGGEPLRELLLRNPSEMPAAFLQKAGQ